MPNSKPLNTLLAPLISYLRSCPLVDNIQLHSGFVLTLQALESWERLHGPERLPDDLKAFYLVSDGMHLMWDVKLHNGVTIPVGNCGVNPLKDYTRCREEVPPHVLAYTIWNCDPVATTCLENDTSSPAVNGKRMHGQVVWVPINAEDWDKGVYYVFGSTKQLLSKTFSGYFRRMCFAAGVWGFWSLDSDTALSTIVRDWVRFYAPSKLTGEPSIPRTVDAVFDSAKVLHLTASGKAKR
ncbi:hypothetical protein DFS34DRAFT_616338 [Phlyctochytrium arcticum]|nr:hypothetical protein DFS34DRAFT_616338 [Phlyctochytrium arcticum]